MPGGGTLLLGLLATTLGGSGAGSRAELRLSGETTWATAVDPRPTMPTRQAWSVRGSATPGATVFLARPVVDDATPLPLQPFLQRASTLRLDVFAGGALRHTPTQGDAHAPLVGAAAALDFYCTRWLIAQASLGFREEALGYSSNDLIIGLGGTNFSRRLQLSLPAGIGLGIRLADLRIDLGYRTVVERRDGVFRRPGWGAIQIGVRAVLLEHIDLALVIETGDRDGTSGRLSVDYHPTRRLGLLAAFAGAADDVSRSLGVRVGLSFWLSRRFGVVATWAPTWRADGVRGTLDQLFVAQIATRI